MVSTALSRRLKLAAPVVAVGVVAAGVTVPRLADAADASAALPPRTAAQLLEDVSQAEVEGLSGTVVATSRLGLPELPSAAGRSGGSAVSLTGLLSGSTTARVWEAGDDRARVAVDAPFAEYDVVRDGTDVWTFDSASADVTHLVLPAGTQQPTAPEPSGTATPLDMAERLLSFVEPTTTVTVGRAEEVAGRAAYELVLEPKDSTTLVEEVRIAVDGETSVPLRVQAFGVDQAEPAVEVAFTSVRFAVPDDSVFDFTPPSGSKVTERSLEDVGADEASGATAPQPTALPQVLGEGWSTVVETSGVQLPESAQGLFAQLSTPAKGGRAITSALLSVLLTDDGRLLVGAVPTSKLEALAAP